MENSEDLYGISDDREHITWFSFEGEFAGDYPACLDGHPSQTTIKAMMPTRVPAPATSTSIVPQPANAMSCCCSVAPALLSILPCRTSPRSCVPVVASGKAERLCITPQMLSKIRKNISFGAQK